MVERETYIAIQSVTVAIRASDKPPADFYAPGRLYAVWDDRDRMLGAYLGHNATLGLPEFRPLVWVGPSAEPLRRVCAGRRAWVRAVGSS